MAVIGPDEYEYGKTRIGIDKRCMVVYMAMSRPQMRLRLWEEKADMIRFILPVFLLILVFAAVPAQAADSVSPVDLEDQCCAWLLESVTSDQQGDSGEFAYLQSTDVVTYEFAYSPSASAVASDTPTPNGDWSKAVRSSRKNQSGILAGLFALLGGGAGGLGIGGGSGVRVSFGGDSNPQTHTGNTGSDSTSSNPIIPGNSIGSLDNSSAAVSDSSSLILFGITALPFFISRFRRRR